MIARIFRPARTATQSGAGKSKSWHLVYAPAAARRIEPLMGWTSSTDMLSQVNLSFATKEEAVAYAERNSIPYRVEEPKPETRKIMSYSDNFRSTRMTPWTH
jgi:hypothetical protein